MTSLRQLDHRASSPPVVEGGRDLEASPPCASGPAAAPSWPRFSLSAVNAGRASSLGASRLARPAPLDAPAPLAPGRHGDREPEGSSLAPAPRATVALSSDFERRTFALAAIRLQQTVLLHETRREIERDRDSSYIDLLDEGEL